MAITTSIHDRVALVTLDWPQRRNALGPAEAHDLAGALNELGANPAVSVVVLTGNGAFCAGGDLPKILELTALGREAVRAALYNDFHAMIKAVVGIPKPIFSAVDGPAVGLGMDLALACDRRFVGDGGWLMQGWARIGLIPGTGGELLLRRLAPSALWPLLTREKPIRGAEAAESGLAEHVPDARAAAVAAAGSLASVPPETLTAYARLHREDLHRQLEAHLERCLAFQTELLSSEDFAGRARRALARG